jgi:hypothetical protein
VPHGITASPRSSVHISQKVSNTFLSACSRVETDHSLSLSTLHLNPRISPCSNCRVCCRSHLDAPNGEDIQGERI